MCFYLAYVSTATRLFDQQDLEALLATCRSHNKANGISGALIYAGGTFMQVIEGDEDEVRALYRRIRRDPRHHDLIKLDEGEEEDREFGDWSMAFRDFTGRMDEVPGFVELVEYLPQLEEGDPSQLRRLLATARKEMQAVL